jgi:hypothetical protein
MGLVAKAFQDIITFSRASSGTYVNSNGYITNSSVLNYLTYSNAPDNAAWTKSNSFVQTNLLLQSQTFNTSWTLGNLSAFGSGSVADATIAPDGTLTADRLAVSTASAYVSLLQIVNVTASTTYTFSYWLNTTTSLSGNTIRIYNVTGAADIVAGQACVYSGGWVRQTCTFTTPVGCTQIYVYPISVTVGAGTVGQYFDIWGAQLVQGSVPGDYVATTSAALPVLYADYNGVVRARKLCEDATATITHFLNRSAAVAGTAQVMSVYAKAGERSQLTLQLGAALAYYNLASGTVISGTNATIELVGDGWYRCILAGTPINNNSQIYLASGGAATYTGDGSSGIYIADAQLNEGSSATAYYDTTASAYNAPRFDYDPVTLAAKGLLIEEQRVNQLLQSNDFATTWTPISVTITQNSTLSPDGNVNADTITASATAVGSRIQQDGVVSLTSQYVYSCYVRPGTVNTVSLSLYNNTTATALATVNFNVATGVVVTTTVGTGTITPAGNGWYRCSVTHSGTVTATNSVRSYVYPNNTSGTTGDSVIIYGAQLEAGAFATSYIPTTTSQVTRAADVASVNTLSPWFNAVGGTIYAEADTFEPPVLTVRNAVTINDGTSNNAHRIISYSTKIGGTTTTAGSTISDLQPLTYTTNTAFKFAYAYAVNDFVAVGNGGAPSTDTAGALPTGLTTMGIGFLSGVVWCGHLRRITYYPRRMTNTELQSLTTL